MNINIPNNPKLPNFREGIVWNDVPKLAILTGINGSGKTLLLNYLSEHKEIFGGEINYISAEWVPGNIKNNSINSPQKSREQILSEGLISDNPEILYEIYKTYDTSTDEIEFPHGIKARINKEMNQNTVIRKDYKIIYDIIKQYGHDLSETDFNNKLILDKKNTLKEIEDFKRYCFIWNEEYKNRLKIAAEQKDHTKSDSIVDCDKPVDIINKLFEKYNFNFSIDYVDQAGSYLPTVSFINKKTRVPLDITKLSSGEKMIISLILWAHSKDTGNRIKCLIVDEPDAHMHPTMSKMLIEIIKDILVDEYDIQVFIATHSPSTIAYAPDESIFEIENGQKEIKKISKIDAIEKLSSGFMTMHNGIRLLHDIFNNNVTVISEGKNIKHIEAAIKILAPELIPQIGFYIHNHGSGEADLKGLYNFLILNDFKLLKPSLFVWDCDSNFSGDIDKLVELRMVKRFAFEKNEKNKIAKKGIENLFPECFFDANLIFEDIEGKHFDHCKKNKFLEKLKKEQTESIFENFKPLIAKIKSIL